MGSTVIDEDVSPIPEVRAIVSNDDDPNQPVWTFRMWTLGISSVVLLSYLNTFFNYRSEPLLVTMISVQVATLPFGKFMAKVLPTKKFRIIGFGDREFSLNPGPFNMKEHVLISIFGNAGAAFGNGFAYAISIVDIIRAFYHRKITFVASLLLVLTTQVCMHNSLNFFCINLIYLSEKYFFHQFNIVFITKENYYIFVK
jgi:OPT family oligopeptide transporter